MGMKKIISMILTATMLCGSVTALAVDYGAEYQNLPTPQITQRFSDVPTTHWAFDCIGEMAQRDVISGYPDGRFIPENQVTRAEFAKIMVCAAGLRVSNNNTTSFTDVYTSDWYCPYVECAKDYLTGYSTSAGTIYKPTTFALREDIAVALVKLKGYDTSLADESILNMFTDNYSISTSARKYIAVAVERGIVSGYGDNTFKGQATITRAEAATLLWRAFQYGNDNKVVDTPPQTVDTPPVTPNTQVVPTQIPTQIEPIAEPTAEPTSVVTEKPYKVDTLASRNVQWVTYDNNGIIYYLSNDNKIYSLAADSAQNEVFDANTMITGEDFAAGPFPISAMCCDTNGNLYITKQAEKSGTLSEIYVIDDGKAELYRDGVKYTKGGVSYHYDFAPIFISGENFVVISAGDHAYYGSIGRFGSQDLLQLCDYSYSLCAAEYNNNLIIATPKGIYKYDYNAFEKISNSYGTAGLSNSGYVIEKDGDFIIHSFDGTNEIRFSLNDCAVNDKTALNSENIYETMFLMPDNSVVFYDISAKAFRMISKNK